MSLEEWIKFLLPIIIPILIPVITGGGVFWIIYKERQDRAEKDKKERAEAITNEATATQTLTMTGATLAKETGNIWQGIIAQLQRDTGELRNTINNLQDEIESLKKEIAKKDNKFIRLVQAVRNSVSKRAKAIDADCTAQRHAELDEELLNEMNAIMTEE